MENSYGIFAEAPVIQTSSYWRRPTPLTKWQKTVQEVFSEYKDARKPITLSEASKIASDKYLIACIEEDNAKHPDARRSARLQKKATLTAPPIKPSAPPAEPIAWAVPYPDDDCDSINSIDTPLTDEEIDSALHDLEKYYD